LRRACLPAAQLGADVLGVDIAANLVAAGNARAQSLGLTNCRFQEGDASDLNELGEESFDLVVSIFGAMFAPKPYDVAQILKISASYSPPPPEGFVSPMLWGVEDEVVERFTAAGVPKEQSPSRGAPTPSTTRVRRQSWWPRSRTITDRR
jgi:hypothetical protein